MNIDLAGWQVTVTSVNHFFFVPVTIGLGRQLPPRREQAEADTPGPAVRYEGP